MYYNCIACVTVYSVFRINKKNHLQVYLEEGNYNAYTNENTNA